jgi:hypothetical protein
MNFTSQICTSRSQSERLLALGLKKETADMAYNELKEMAHALPYTEVVLAIERSGDRIWSQVYSPAWSLHRLIEMMPKRIKNVKEDWDMCGHDIAFVITEELDVNYEEPFEDYPCYNKYFHEGNLYDKIVNSIAWLIQEGYFYKEYLE